MSEGNTSEPGRPRLAPSRGSGPGPRQEVEETKLSGNRRGVGRAHSTCEALEQARDERRRRAGREGARSEGRRTATHAPDPVPDKACHRRRAPADRNYRGRQALNADHVRPSTGARCGKAARRDLRGGRRAIAVPTATARSRNAPKSGEADTRDLTPRGPLRKPDLFVTPAYRHVWFACVEDGRGFSFGVSPLRGPHF